MLTDCKLVPALAVAALVSQVSEAQFQVATGTAQASAECLIADIEQLRYGYNDDVQIEFYPSIELSRALNKTLDAGGFADATGSLLIDFPTPRRVVVSGSTTSSVESGPTTEEAFAEGIADLELRFTLPTGGTYLIQSASLTSVEGLSTLSLGTAESDLIAFDSLSGQDPTGATGTLPPGEYIFHVSAFSSADLAFTLVPLIEARFSVDFRVTPTCIADITNDGFVELSDFFEFLNCFDAGTGCADIDNVDGLDLGDFFAFLGAFDAGC